MAWVLPSIMVVMAAALLLLPAFVTFDRLVKREHDHFAQAWEADGRPHGMFWRPEMSFRPSVRLFRSGLVTNRCMLVWPLRTPHWAGGDEEAMRLLRRLRRLLIAWNLGVLVLAAVAAVVVCTIPTK